jgi:hypothetical protein
MAKPNKKEYPPFYKTYIDVLDDQGNLLDHLEDSLRLFEKELYKIKENKQEFRYAEGKWTIKEIVQHLIDTERVFVYRALRYSRNDMTPLSSFDENAYVSNYNINERNFNMMLDEFSLLRRSTILMFQDFDTVILDKGGKVGEKDMSVRALGYICSGHVFHHLKIIRERYV